MRCPDCNKFVPFNTDEEPEENGEPTIEGMEFHAEYRRFLSCEECGNELKETYIEVTQDLSDGEEETCPKGDENDKEHEWEFDLDVTPSMRTEGKGRGTTTYYGVEVSGTATCSKCSKKLDIKCEEDVQASAFDELV